MEDLLKRYTVREVVLVSTSTGAFAESAEPLWTSKEKGLMGTSLTRDAPCQSYIDLLVTMYVCTVMQD
jgi:hypothetical protein